MPPPFQPMSGDDASLQVDGVFPYSAILQIAAEDTERDYVYCRGFDPRISKFIEYESGNANKPGIPAGKPYGKRHVGAYSIAEVFQALLPLQTTNPSPASVDWRVRQNPGYAVGGEGHPQYLGEKIDELYTKEGKLINYMLVDEGEPSSLIVFTCLEDRTRELSAGGLNFGRATALITDKVGSAGDDIGESVTVWFGDKRWFGTVKGCEGIAIYQFDADRAAELGLDDPWLWIVVEAQELTAGFWFTLKNDRTVDTEDEDVEVKEVLKNIGHANADFPVEQWKSTGADPPNCGGQSVWVWDDELEEWQGPIFDTCGPDCKAVPPSFPGPAWGISGCEPTGVPPAGSDPLKVRFLGDTFPYAFEDAVGYAVLDVDIANVTDNSTMRYYVVQCDQGSILNEVEHEEFCPGGSPAVSQHSPAGWYPFGMKWPDELITNVYDRMDLASENGGTGWTTYSHLLRQHVILNTEHEEYEFLQDVPQGSCVPNKLKIQALTCESPEASTGFSFENVISDVTFELDANASGSGSGATCTDPTFKLKTKTKPALVCGPESAQSTASTLQLVVQDAVSDMDMSGCPEWTNSIFLVFAVCGEYDEAADCTDCEESGSGS